MSEIGPTAGTGRYVDPCDAIARSQGRGMNLQSIASKILAGELNYVIGRFKTVRATYSHVRRIAERFAPNVSDNRDGQSTLFPHVDVDPIAQEVRSEAVFIGLNLPADIVAEIRAFAESEPLHASYDPDGSEFMYSEVANGNAPTVGACRSRAFGTPVAVLL